MRHERIFITPCNSPCVRYCTRYLFCPFIESCAFYLYYVIFPHIHLATNQTNAIRNGFLIKFSLQFIIKFLLIVLHNSFSNHRCSQQCSFIYQLPIYLEQNLFAFQYCSYKQNDRIYYNIKLITINNSRVKQTVSTSSMTCI